MKRSIRKVVPLFVAALLPIGLALPGCKSGSPGGGAALAGNNSGAIVVVEAAARPITARDVFRGVNAAFTLKLQEGPGVFPHIWKKSVKLMAGQKLLWESDENSPYRRNPEIFRGYSEGYSKDVPAQGRFDLSSVPVDAGEIAVVWKAELQYRRQGNSNPEPETATAEGRIVLRPAGQTLPMPKVDKNPHLKIRRVEVLPLQKASFGSGFAHPIKLHLERDKEFVRSLSADELKTTAISYDFFHVPGPATRTNVPLNGGASTFPNMAATPEAAMSKEFLFPVESVEFLRNEELAGGTLVEFNLSLGSRWPLRFTIPFTRADGTVITGDARPKLITDGKPKPLI